MHGFISLRAQRHPDFRRLFQAVGAHAGQTQRRARCSSRRHHATLRAWTVVERCCPKYWPPTSPPMMAPEESGPGLRPTRWILGMCRLRPRPAGLPGLPARAPPALGRHRFHPHLVAAGQPARLRAHCHSTRSTTTARLAGRSHLAGTANAMTPAPRRRHIAASNVTTIAGPGRRRHIHDRHRGGPIS
jgi:hypothetical protein